MIVFTNTFALSEPGLDKPRIGWHTYTRTVDGVPSNLVITVSSESADGPKDAPLRPETHEVWVATALPATWKIDFGSSQQMDYAAIGGHTLGSTGATVLIETSLDDSAYTTFASSLAPADDAAIMFLDTQRAARYVRVTITNGLARCAVFNFGLVLKMIKSVSGGYTPISMSRESEQEFAMSRGGNFLGSAFRRHGISGSIAFQNLPAAWVRTNFNPFTKWARGEPYFLAWNPLEYPLEAGYVWTGKDIRPKYVPPLDNMDVSWDMVGKGNV